MKKNWLTTLGGIMAGFGVVPIAFGTAKVPLPSWLYILCIFLAAMGPVIIGVSAKGQDEHSTLDQVHQSTKEANDASGMVPAPGPNFVQSGPKGNAGSKAP